MELELRETINSVVHQNMINGDKRYGSPQDALEVINHNPDEFWDDLKCELYLEWVIDLDKYKSLREEIYDYANTCFDELFDEWE